MIAIIKIIKKYNKKLCCSINLHNSNVEIKSEGDFNININIITLLNKQDIYNCQVLKDIYKKTLVKNIDDISISNIYSLVTLRNIRDNTNFTDYPLLPGGNSINNWDNKSIDDYLTTKLGINNELTNITIAENVDLTEDENEIPQTPIYKKFFYSFWIITLLYLFLFGLDLMGISFKVLSGSSIKNVLSSINNPIAGLCMGVIATVLLQSSSTTTSIIVTMVGAKIISVQNAIPAILGSNIGTSVTSTIVAHAHVSNKEQYKKAFAGATVHDMFNILSVIVILPIEVISSFFGGGMLYSISKEITNGLLGQNAGEFDSPLKKIVTPIVNEFLKIDKNVIKGQVIGCLNCTLTNTSTMSKYCWDLSKEVCMTDGDWNKKYMNGNIVIGGFLKDLNNDTWGGVIGLIISIFVLCFTLYNIVKTLHRLVIKSQGRGRLITLIKKSLDLSPYLTIIFGMGLTIIVQSSSITTSTFTPLVGLSIITIEQMLPLTLGANLGTCSTAILASLVSENEDAMQVAFAHLIFNIIGIAIWYPIPFMRKVPIAFAKRLGDLISEYKWFGVFYILYAFVTIPIVCYGLSFMIIYNTVGLIFGIFFLVLIGTGTIFLLKYFELIYACKCREIKIPCSFNSCKRKSNIVENELANRRRVIEI